MKKNIVIILVILIIMGCFVLSSIPKKESETPPVIEEEIHFYFTDVSVELKKNETYETLIEFEDNKEYEIYFNSDNPSIASIDKNGVITAKDYGVTIVSALVDSEIITNMEVRVVEEEIASIIKEPIIPVQKLDILQKEISIKSSEKYQLKTNIYPSNATNQNLIYETNDSRIAEVTDTGLVIGRTSGTTTINVYSNNEKTDFVTVNVTAPIIELDSITLMPSELTLNLGDSYQFKPYLIPANINGKVKWTSTNEAIVTVDSNGLVTAKKEGSVVVTATCEDKSSSATVIVKNEKTNIVVSKINFDRENITLKADESIKINTSIIPSNATNKALIWSSSNNSIATVSNNGTVKGISKGNAIITAKSVNGITNTINVTVTTTTISNTVITPTEIILSSSDFSLENYQTKQLRVTVLPMNSISQELTWISSDENVATVSSNGLVTAKKIGDATIAVMTSNGKVAKAKVTVTAKPITPSTRATKYSGGNLTSARIRLINGHLNDFIEEAAYKARKTGTISERRAKAMAAAYFLIYNPYYKVPYGYGRLSQFDYQGWNPKWNNTVGVECQGFVTWSLIQAGVALGTNIQYYPARITQTDPNKYWTVDYVLSIPGIQVGDVLNRRYPRDANNNKLGNGHWAIIMDIDRVNCSLTVAHATSVKEGLHLTTYKCGKTIYYNRVFNTDKYP